MAAGQGCFHLSSEGLPCGLLRYIGSLILSLHSDVHTTPPPTEDAAEGALAQPSGNVEVRRGSNKVLVSYDWNTHRKSQRRSTGPDRRFQFCPALHRSRIGTWSLRLAAEAQGQDCNSCCGNSGPEQTWAWSWSRSMCGGI